MRIHKGGVFIYLAVDHIERDHPVGMGLSSFAGFCRGGGMMIALLLAPRLSGSFCSSPAPGIRSRWCK